MQNTVGVARERRYMYDCSAVNGILPELLKFFKLLTVRLVPATRTRLRRVKKPEISTL